MKKIRQQKMLQRIACAALAGMMVTGLAVTPGTVSAIPNKTYEQKTSLQPYGRALHIDELLDWSPETDPDARYNRGSVPLAERSTGPLVNPLASKDVRVMNLALSNPRATEGPSQGSEETAACYAFNFFQYLGTYNFWGGSYMEGIVAIPPAEHIDAAHRNGVPVTGTIFFPWGMPGSDIQDKTLYTKWVHQFVQQDEDGSFPVADKLIEIADYFGFEGFFINLESFSIQDGDTAKMQEMFQYIQKKRPDFILQWYDSVPTGGSGPSYQNAFNAYNIGWLQNGDEVVCDEGFMNFNWSQHTVNQTVDTLTAAGRSPYDAFATLEFPKNGGNFTGILDENGKARLSIGLLQATQTQSDSSSIEEFQNVNDPNAWVGPAGDPRTTTAPSKYGNGFYGIARYAADHTPITSTPFVTHFIAGNGYNFYKDGEIIKDHEWYNRSMTEVLPTWRWIIDSKGGSDMDAIVDYEDAYYGGTSLKFSGAVAAEGTTDIMLYSTDLDITDSTELEMVFKANSDLVGVEVGVSFGDINGESYNPDDFVYLPLEPAEMVTDEWVTATVDLGEYAGENMIALSLRFTGKEDVAEYSANFGKLAITDDKSAPEAPGEVILDEALFEDYSNAEARIYWEPSPDAVYYEVYMERPDGSSEFLASSPSNALYVPRFFRDGAEEDKVTFKVVPYSAGDVEGEAAYLDFNWTIPWGSAETIDHSEVSSLIAGKVGIDHTGAEVSQMTDGVVTQVSKWCPAGTASTTRPHYVTYDMGEPVTVSRWKVFHANAPGSGESPNYNTGAFELRYSDDKEEWHTADSRKNSLEDNEDITDRNLKEPITARYFQLYVTNSQVGPQWAATRIPEFELYAEPKQNRTKPVSMYDVHVSNNAGATDTVTMENVPNGATVRLYDAIDSEEAIAELETVTGTALFENLELNAEGGRLYYATVISPLDESVRRSVAYAAENADHANQPSDYDIMLRSSHSLTYAAKNDFYGVMDIRNLKVGDSFKVYDSLEAEEPIAVSNTASSRQNSARASRIPLSNEGGTVYVEIHSEGLLPSERKAVSYDLGRIDELAAALEKASEISPADWTTESYDVLKNAVTFAKENALTDIGVLSAAVRTDILTALENLEAVGYIPDYTPTKPVKPAKPAYGWEKQADGTWVYNLSTGTKATGWFNDNGPWYYLDDEGIMQTGWIQSKGNWFYLTGSGAMATGWQKVDGVWYYFRDWGGMVTDWMKIKGEWYYFRDWGGMAENSWILGRDGEWYYTGSDGAMVENSWILGRDGEWYYTGSDGAMLTDTTTPDGYKVDASGAWIR